MRISAGRFPEAVGGVDLPYVVSGLQLEADAAEAQLATEPADRPADGEHPLQRSEALVDAIELMGQRAVFAFQRA